MNVYVVLEGELGAKKLYTAWIPYVNPQLTYAATIADVVNNNFYVEAAFGYPGYFDRIRSAIENVATLELNGVRQFDRLVIAIDSEDLSFSEKEQEVLHEIQPSLKKCFPQIDCRIVIQHFCFETWALANRRLAETRPDPRVSDYRAIHNVHTLDPELLPALPAEDLNRAQFAYKYLRLLHNARYSRQTYSKNDPKVVSQKGYYEEVRARMIKTGHIPSFDRFLGAFA